jgi:hypothetical protein
LNWVPSTNTLNATNISGALTGTASNASAVNTTSDNTSGTYYIPFTKTSAGTGKILYVDDTTGPLSYNPSTATLTTTILSGALSAPITQNSAIYTSGTQTLQVTNQTSFTFQNFAWTMTGDINNLVLISFRANGLYKIFLTNTSATPRLVNDILGGTANIKTGYTGDITIPATTGKGIIYIEYDGTTYYVNTIEYS